MMPIGEILQLSESVYIHLHNSGTYAYKILHYMPYKYTASSITRRNIIAHIHHARSAFTHFAGKTPPDLLKLKCVMTSQSLLRSQVSQTAIIKTTLLLRETDSHQQKLLSAV